MRVDSESGPKQPFIAVVLTGAIAVIRLLVASVLAAITGRKRYPFDVC